MEGSLFAFATGLPPALAADGARLSCEKWALVEAAARACFQLIVLPTPTPPLGPAPDPVFSLFPQLLAGRSVLTNSTSQISHAAETAPVYWPQTQIAPACHIIAVQFERETLPPR